MKLQEVETVARHNYLEYEYDKHTLFNFDMNTYKYNLIYPGIHDQKGGEPRTLDFIPYQRKHDPKLRKAMENFIDAVRLYLNERSF